MDHSLSFCLTLTVNGTNMDPISILMSIRCYFLLSAQQGMAHTCLIFLTAVLLCSYCPFLLCSTCIFLFAFFQTLISSSLVSFLCSFCLLFACVYQTDTPACLLLFDFIFSVCLSSPLFISVLCCCPLTLCPSQLIAFSVSPPFLFSFHPPTFALNLFHLLPPVFRLEITSSEPKCRPLIAFCRSGRHSHSVHTVRGHWCRCGKWWLV